MIMKQINDLEGVSDMKDEVEKEKEDLAVQLGVAQTMIQSFNQTGKTSIIYNYIRLVIK